MRAQEQVFTLANGAADCRSDHGESTPGTLSFHRDPFKTRIPAVVQPLTLPRECAASFLPRFISPHGCGVPGNFLRKSGEASRRIGAGFIIVAQQRPCTLVVNGPSD